LTRSWPELGRTVAASVLALHALVAACGEPPGSQECTSSALTYQTFGEPFIASWCRGCHSAELLPEMRQQAPLEVNFNSKSEVQRFAKRISFLVATAATMPPAGGPTAAERALLQEWIACGAR
jgi:uncharacterized membrane protein